MTKSHRIFIIMALVFSGCTSASTRRIAATEPDHSQDTANNGAFELRIDPNSDLSEDEIQSLAPEIERISKMIPEEMKSIIARPIQLRFKQIGNGEIHVPVCPHSIVDALRDNPSEGKTAGEQPDEIHHSDLYGYVLHVGTLESPIIHVHKDLAKILTSSEASADIFACGHKNMKRLAQATILHELGHLYDYKKNSSSEKRYQKLVHFTGKRGVVSWLVYGGLIPDHLGTKNHLVQESPDPYEFKNIRESFAVNLEFFLMDPDYACRKPALWNYLTEKLGAPFGEPKCKLNTQVFLNNDARDPGNLIDLNPSRIYQIQYLFASKGEEMMSRWGHAMFRIIGCAPERLAPGPDCLKDYKNHYVVSFRANVNDLKMNQVKGMFGGYPSELFIMPFEQVHSEYTRTELRDLISLPIKLSETEKQEFIYSALETYWDYQGSYEFFTNNCSTESADLLKSILTDPRAQKLKDLTPLGLYKDLGRQELINSEVMKSPDQAEAQGILFRSKRADVKRIYSNIQTYFPELKTYKNFLAKSSAAQRLEGYHTASGRVSNHRQIAASFYFLETFFELKADAAFSKKLVQELERVKKHDKENLSKDDQSLLRLQEQMLKSQTLSTHPSDAVRADYGIPLPVELSSYIQAAKTNVLDPKTLEEAQTLLEAKFRSEREALKATLENKAFFKSELLK